MKSLRIMILGLAALAVAACNTLGSLAGPPPQLPPQVQTISRTAISFAFNAFDAALYGIDAAIALPANIPGHITPGSDRAKQIARVGRQVQTALNAAESARRAGNSASYEEAFANANAALTQFRSLLGKSPVAFGYDGPPLSPADRSAALDRLAA